MRIKVKNFQLKIIVHKKEIQEIKEQELFVTGLIQRDLERDSSSTDTDYEIEEKERKTKGLDCISETAGKLTQTIW